MGWGVVLFCLFLLFPTSRRSFPFYFLHPLFVAYNVRLATFTLSVTPSYYALFLLFTFLRFLFYYFILHIGVFFSSCSLMIKGLFVCNFLSFFSLFSFLISFCESGIRLWNCHETRHQLDVYMVAHMYELGSNNGLTLTSVSMRPWSGDISRGHSFTGDWSQLRYVLYLQYFVLDLSPKPAYHLRATFTTIARGVIHK